MLADETRGAHHGLTAEHLGPRIGEQEPDLGRAKELGRRAGLLGQHVQVLTGVGAKDIDGVPALIGEQG